MSRPVQPLAGDFGVVHMGGDVGKWIRVGQTVCDWIDHLRPDPDADDYEHAFVYVGGGQIVEAQPGPAGARLTQIHYGHILWSTDIIPLTLEQRRRIVEAARGYIGVPYSAMDYFAITAKELKLGVLVPGLKTYVASSKHMICSQLVDQCYTDAGVHLFKDGRWPGYVKPSSLARLLSG